MAEQSRSGVLLFSRGLAHRTALRHRRFDALERQNPHAFASVDRALGQCGVHRLAPTRDLDADQQATGRTRPVEAVTKQPDRDDGADVRISDGTGTWSKTGTTPSVQRNGISAGRRSTAPKCVWPRKLYDSVTVCTSWCRSLPSGAWALRAETRYPMPCRASVRVSHHWATVPSVRLVLATRKTCGDRYS